MGVVTVAGQGVIGATVCLPRVGAWHMDATLDTDAQLSGQVKVALGDSLELTGTIVAGGPYTETGYYRIVGGANGLRSSAKPKAYGQCQLRIPLKDLLEGVGEKLASDADAQVLGVQLAAWSTLGVPAGRQLAALLQSAPKGTAWRVQPGGSIWVGLETWPDAGISYEETGALPHEHKIEITTEDPTLLPGTTLDGRRVSYVEHKIDSGSLRTLVYLEASA